ncbi:MAG: carboxypeptidase-like regulatory domain-containing protein [Ferruginibacter sp.]
MSTIKFTIPEPCHENWHAMNIIEQGRFCTSCQKDVIDFSKMNDPEIFDILLKGDANKCGRFSAAQMKSGINYAVEKKMHWHKYFFSLLLPAALLTKQSSAQVGLILKRNVVSRPIAMHRITNPFTDKSFVIQGRVVDSMTNELIEGATITIMGTSNGTAVNKDGAFKLEGKANATAVTIKITATGYESTEIDIAVPADNFIMTEEIFPLKKRVIRLDEVTLHSTSESLSGILGGISMGVKLNRFKEFPIRLVTAITDSIRVSPNPVMRGNTFNVTLKLKKPGNHTMQIIDLAGKVILQQSITASGKQFTGQITCENSWSAGVYILRIIGSGNQVTSTTRFVVE